MLLVKRIKRKITWESTLDGMLFWWLGKTSDKLGGIFFTHLPYLDDDYLFWSLQIILHEYIFRFLGKQQKPIFHKCMWQLAMSESVCHCALWRSSGQIRPKLEYNPYIWAGVCQFSPSSHDSVRNLFWGLLEEVFSVLQTLSPQCSKLFSAFSR